MNLTSWLSFIIRHRNMSIRRFTHRGMDPSITYLLFTKLRRWTSYRHTIHESAYPTWRFNNASATRYDDIFVLRGPQTRRHLAHRDRKTTCGHVEYITATQNKQYDSSTPPILTNLQKIYADDSCWLVYLVLQVDDWRTTNDVLSTLSSFHINTTTNPANKNGDASSTTSAPRCWGRFGDKSDISESNVATSKRMSECRPVTTNLDILIFQMFGTELPNLLKWL